MKWARIDDEKVKTQAPTSTRRYQKLVKSTNHQRIQQEATNRNTQDKEELTNSGATVKYKYATVGPKVSLFQDSLRRQPGVAVKPLREPKRQ